MILRSLVFIPVASTIAFSIGCTAPTQSPDSGSTDAGVSTPDSTVVGDTSVPSDRVIPDGSTTPIPTPQAMDCTHRGSGRDIQVGNSQVETGSNIVQVNRIGDVDWNNLQPGDTVRIFWRDTAYHEKILVKSQGTPTQPIRICGVPGPSGQLPTIDGDHATTRADLDYGGVDNLMQDLGVVVIWNRSYEQKAQYISIEGLHIRNTLGSPGNPDNVLHYTATDGTNRSYRPAAACLRIQEGEHITLRGNELEGCGNGLFVLSRVPEVQMTRDILIEGNYLHGNGVVTLEGIHNAYVQGVNVTVQYNRFGENRPNASGNNLKMRTAGDVIRYNYFENGARILDLVEVEDHAQLVLPWLFEEFRQANPTEVLPGDEERVMQAWNAYQRTYVYGNVIVNRGDMACTNIVHYSFDNTQDDRRPGTLYFYFNTLVNRTDRSSQDFVRLLDQGPYWGNSGPALRDNRPESYAVMVATNNVIYNTSATSGQRQSYWEFTRYRADKLQLGVNWISEGWNDAVPGYNQMFPGFGNANVTNLDFVYPGGNDTHHVTGAESLISAATAPIDLQTFRPLPNGMLANRASALPAEIPVEHIPTLQLDVRTNTIVPRTSLTTLGALEAE